MRHRVPARLGTLLVLTAVLLGMFMPVSAASPSVNAQATSSVFTPDADAMVKSAYPATNFGTENALRARYSPTVRCYMRFTISGLNGAPIASAKLRLYATTSSSQSVVLKMVSNNTWSETGITYNNAPSLGYRLGASPASYAAGSWITFDVTQYVKGDGTYSFGLATGSTSIHDFASRESGSSTAPQLVVTPDSWQPSFPIRAAFYYPWFPEAWKQNGIYPYTNYNPQLGFYSSADSSIIQQHIQMMQYANIEAGIASWWGQGSQTDSKIAGLLSAASGSNFRWALYYEMESRSNPSASQIHSDLAYIRNHYGEDPSYLRINGKFVVFVYSSGGDGCAMATRWKQANTVGAYVVLKVFPGYGSCASQPNSWHQYSPAVAASQQKLHSYSISPGFWKVGKSVVLPRDVTRWTQNVQDMVASGAQWQLITTFSEWGEGTATEPAAEWSSTSGYGQYLDALHDNP